MVQQIAALSIVRLKAPGWIGWASDTSNKVPTTPDKWYLKFHEEILGSSTVLDIEQNKAFRITKDAISVEIALLPGIKLLVRQDPSKIFVVDEILTLNNFWVWDPSEDARLYCTLQDVLGVVEQDDPEGD